VLYLEGIQVNTKDFSGQVKIRMAQVTGDNLSIQTVLGFSDSFSANYYCRWCKMKKNIAHVTTKEDSTLFRNVQNYEDDLALNNFSETGLKFSSIFNDISYYHVTDNICPDIMHDVFEGVALHDMRLFFKHLIQTGKFSGFEIQNRILAFNYSPLIKNKPVVTENFIKGKTSSLTAAQAMHLINVIPLIFGNELEDGDLYLDLVCQLVALIRIMMAPSISESGIQNLENCIQRHHILYLELCGGHLTPKHHHMLHYSTALLKLGPLKAFWAMRFEAKHRLAKTIMKASRNFKNVAKTVASRYLLDFAYNLILNTDAEFEIFETRAVKITESCWDTLYLRLPNFTEETVLITEKCTFKGSLVIAGTIILIDWTDIEPYHYLAKSQNYLYLKISCTLLLNYFI
jgi:hypothetical protein